MLRTLLKKEARLYKESVALLFEGSQKAVLFNIALSFLLSIDLVYHGVPSLRVWIWFSGLCLISVLRLALCVYATRSVGKGKDTLHLNLFFFSTLLTGGVWSLSYFFSIAYLNLMQEAVIILVYGGMCAGAITSLSPHLPSYMAYCVPIFLPVIVYNVMLMTFDRFILSIIFLLFIFGLGLLGKINNALLMKTFKLSDEKETLIRKLRLMSTTDPLTHLMNRNHFDEILKEECNRAIRNKHAMILIAFDVDNFKLVNDHCGHHVGDMLLIYISHLLQSSFRRSSDKLFRLGGDEFFAILSNTSLEDTVRTCKKISTQINVMKTQLESDTPSIFDEITMSIGIVEVPFSTEVNVKDAVIEADRALYQSKQRGKNQIVTHRLH